MRWWQIIIIAALCALPLSGRAQSALFFQGTIYEAIECAQQEDKLLLVEFYAKWSHKSRWMHDNVLSKSNIGSQFLAISIDTDTDEGAKMASGYDVSDYPVILVCNSRGVVIDKIDRTLSIEDFKARLNTVRLSTDRQSVSQLQQIFALSTAADQDSRNKANERVAIYIEQHDLPTLTSQSHWDLFSNSAITYYGSNSYKFLTQNISSFFAPDQALELQQMAVAEALMPYIVGSVEFDSVFISTIEQDTLSLSLYPTATKLCKLVRFRAEKELSQYINLLAETVDEVNENYEYQLVMSVGFIVPYIDDSNRSIKLSARRLLEKLQRKTLSPSKTVLIESLLAKFS